MAEVARRALWPFPPTALCSWAAGVLVAQGGDRGLQMGRGLPELRLTGALAVPGLHFLTCDLGLMRGYLPPIVDRVKRDFGKGTLWTSGLYC